MSDEDLYGESVWGTVNVLPRMRDDLVRLRADLARAQADRDALAAALRAALEDIDRVTSIWREGHELRTLYRGYASAHRETLAKHGPNP